MKEVKDNRFICTNDGLLNAYSVGWSKIPFKDCTIKNRFFRKKIWNHYMWIGKDFVFVFAVVNLDYAAVVFTDFYDLNSKRKINKCVRHGLSKNIMMDDKINSYAHYKDKHRFINVLRVNNYLNVEFKWDEIDITSTINLGYESINALIPWTYKYFHYTSKHTNLETKGELTVDNKKYNLDDSLVFIDYGRGVWQRKKEWYWLTSGFIDEKGKSIGLNLGAKYTDGTGVNENGIKIDDTVYKLDDDVEFNYDKENNKWIIKSVKSDEVDLEFIPIVYNNKVNNIIIFKSKSKQFVGYLNGVVMLKGKEIKFNNTIGWCEDHFAKW